MEGVPSRPGASMRCGACMGEDLLYLDGGFVRCRACGWTTTPEWVGPSRLTSSEPSTPLRVSDDPRPATRTAPRAGPTPPGHGGWPPVGDYPQPAYRSADFGSIFTGTLRVFFRNPAQILLPYILLAGAEGIGFFIAVSPFLDPSMFQFDPTAPPASVMSSLTEFLVAILTVTALIAAIFFVPTTLVQGVVTHFAVLRHRNAKVTLSFSFRQGVRRLLTLLGSQLLVYAILLGLLAVAFVPVFVGLVTLNFVLVGIGFLAFIGVAIPLIYVSLALTLTQPSVMMEDVTAVGSLRSSWALTKGYKASIFGAQFVLALIGLAIVYAAALGLGGMGSLSLSFILQMVIGGITSSWIIIANAVAYDLVAGPVQFVPYAFAPSGRPSA